MRTLRNKAFTLVEILIVVVILGILAAIVVPQFASATKDAQAGNLKAQIKEIQNQLELSKARSTHGQYNDPSTDDWASFIAQGYIRAKPKNPFNGLTTVSTTNAVLDPVTGQMPGVANFGWVVNPLTGDFTACYFDEAAGVIDAANP